MHRDAEAKGSIWSCPFLVHTSQRAKSKFGARRRFAMRVLPNTIPALSFGLKSTNPTKLPPAIHPPTCLCAIAADVKMFR